MLHKKIFFEENVPLFLEFVKMKTIYDYWQKDLQLIFIISGAVIVTLQGKTKKFTKTQTFIINSNELYSLLPETEETELLVLHLDVNFIDKYIKNFSTTQFNLDSINNNSEDFKTLSSYLGKILFIFKNADNDYKAKILTCAFELTEFLMKNYIKTNENFPDKNLEENRKITKISDFIETNYAEPISLKILGETFNLNPQYISRFFKKSVGMGFQDYLNSLRVKKSINDLLYSTTSILEIALINGFNEGKTYTRAFKKEYGMNPAEFRKLSGKNKNEQNSLLKEDLILNDNLEFLLKYLSYDKNQMEGIPQKKNFIIECDTSQSFPYEKRWKKIMAFGRAYEGLLGEVQEQMRIIQKEIGFEYVRFTGIFNDEMMVYSENELGEPIYNWNYVDKLIDFLQSVNLKPFINIGYMPESLAKDKVYIFKWKGNVSFPSSMDKWNTLIKEFILHLIERYGKEIVDTWSFEIWNNPDLSNHFWYETREKYFEFFKNTLNSIKGISEEISVGGPSGGSLFDKNHFNFWMNDLYKYMKNNKYSFDFFSMHIFSSLKKDDYVSSKYGLTTNKTLVNDLVTLKNQINTKCNKTMKLIVSEWNPGAFYGDYTHDTSFMATNIVENIINIFDKIDGLAFWSFTDVFEEYGIGHNIFHGGFGLFTLNGLKKSSYNAYLLLNKLGNEIIDRGDGWIVTKNEKNIQVLMCNHLNFNKQYLSGNYSKADYYNRYQVFEDDKLKEIKIVLKNLEKGKYLLKRTRLNRDSGSVFDAWIKMGAPENINMETLKILKSKENMDIYIKKEEIIKELELTEALGGHCVTLFEIEKQI